MTSIETLPAPDLSATEGDAWEHERDAFRRLLPELLRTHLNEFVAIHEGRVVGSGVDKVEVARLAYERFGYVPIFVSQVAAGSPTPLRIPSPRRLAGPSA